jgi:hypothetical protein
MGGTLDDQITGKFDADLLKSSSRSSSDAVNTKPAGREKTQVLAAKRQWPDPENRSRVCESRSLVGAGAAA